MDDALHELIDLLRVDPYYRPTATFFEELAKEAAAGGADQREVAQKVVSVLASGEFADIVLQDSGVVLAEQSRFFLAVERLRVAASSALHSRAT